MFNTPATLNRTKLLTYYLCQELVPVPGVARARAQQELDDSNVATSCHEPHKTSKKTKTVARILLKKSR
jgi:hypothetical protein